MPRNSQPNGKSVADASAAGPRRLRVEKLELRSILAALNGLPDQLELPPDNAEDLALLPRFRHGEFRFSGPGQLMHPGLSAESQDTFPASDTAASRPLFFQMADPEAWADLREINLGNVRIIDSLPLDSVTVDSIWQVRPGGNWPMLQKPWLDRLPEIVPEADQLLPSDLPWSGDAPNSGEIANNNSDESPANEPSGGPLDSTPDQVPAPSSPGLNIKSTLSNRELIEWLEFDDTPTSLSCSIRDLALHPVSSHRDRSNSPSTAKSRESHEDEGQGLEREGQESTSEDLTTGLLELPSARLVRTSPFVPADKRGAPSTSAPRPGGGYWSSSGVAPALSDDVAQDLADIFGTNDVVAAYDEGGLVELFTVAAIRSPSYGKTPAPHASSSSPIDAEIGLFQAIDVATSVIADPSYAAMNPLILVAVFQLFDQRRKVEDLESRLMGGKGLEPLTSTL